MRTLLLDRFMMLPGDLYVFLFISEVLSIDTLLKRDHIKTTYDFVYYKSISFSLHLYSTEIAHKKQHFTTVPPAATVVPLKRLTSWLWRLQIW